MQREDRSECDALLGRGHPTDIDSAVLEKLLRLADAPVVVALREGSGRSVDDDWWSASIDDLGLVSTEFGALAALTGLTTRIAGSIDTMLDDALKTGDRKIPILLRLWLASQTGGLGDLVVDSAGYLGDYDAPKPYWLD
jgi:hypothetical protein